jgi:hypothetical protein
VLEVPLATQQIQLRRATAAPARELWNELAEHHLVSLSMSTHQEAITSKSRRPLVNFFTTVGRSTRSIAAWFK